MTVARAALSAVLAATLCAPASAQIYEGRLSGVRLSEAPPVSLTPSVAPTVSALPVFTGGLSLVPALASLRPMPKVSAAPAAVSLSVSAVSEEAAPALRALQAPDLKGEDASSAAERAMAPVLGRSREALPVSVSAPIPALEGPKLRGAPLLRKIDFAPEISAEHRRLLLETLTRRKAGWTRQLAAMGVKLEGPVEPAISVRAAKDTAKGAKAEFTIDWNQGETRVGAFKAVVTLKNVDPELRRLPAPEPPKERQVRMRFNKTALSDADIDAYLEAKRLRLLSKSWDGTYTVSVTGSDRASAVADAASGRGIVLYATPVSFAVPETSQVQIAFKSSAGEAGIGEFLSARGLRVLALDRDGVYTVGAEGLAAESSARLLQDEPSVLYAKPLRFDPPAFSQLILSLREGAAEEGISPLLRRHGLLLVKILNNGAYKAARVSDATPAKDLLAALAHEPTVKQVLALGGLADEQIEGAARGVASYKGRPWSATEYNMAYGTAYWSLEERGATPEQLKLFEKLCADAPVRGGGFNPWSGD